MLGVFFVTTLVTLVTVVGAAALLRKYVPRSYARLTGGR